MLETLAIVEVSLQICDLRVNLVERGGGRRGGGVKEYH
jgi:hypothetical protein